MISEQRALVFDDGNKIFWLLILLAIFVYVSPLGIMPLLDDEPIRALVSIEMYLSGNYWVPTTNGELYQNKPPLFNWIIAGLMQVIPNFNEFFLRIPSIITLCVTTICTYFFLKNEIGWKASIYTAFAFLTCGRILLVDSMLGYIDPFFSLAIFLNLFLIYKKDVSSEPWTYFLLSYFLCLIAFMLKGLPAIVFQFISLAVALALKSRFKKLFSLHHFFGILLFLAGIATYYAIYSRHASLGSLFSTLWEQSTKRTVTSFSFLDSFLYVLGFPFEFVLHFLPWSLLVVLCIRKDMIRIIRGNNFIKFACFIFMSNIWVYWLSPETRPRYLFMFLPFFFAILFYVYEHHASIKQKKYIFYFTLSVSVLLAFSSLIPFFVHDLAFVEHKTIKVLVIFFSTIFISLYCYKNPSQSVLGFIAVLFIARLGFNFFVLPSREREAPETEYKRFGTDIGNLSMNTPLYLLEGIAPDNNISFYISNTNHKILSRIKGKPKRGELYVCRKSQLIEFQLHPLYTFYTDWNKEELFLAKK